MPSTGQITAGELARVCSHYDLGVVSAARKLKRGSRAAPKVLLESDRGRFLLKRRAPGRDDPATVAISHEVQLFLAKRGFPTPPLLGTRRDNNSMLQLDGRVYEVFTFVDGYPYQRTPGQTAHAGAALAHLHDLLTGLTPAWQPPVGSFHAAPAVLERLASIPAILTEPQARAITRDLQELYADAAREAQRHASLWRPAQLIHADWHPGNLIFADQADAPIVAVLDFDSVRIAPPIVDLANAALQFSVLRRDPGAASQPPSQPQTKSDQIIELPRYQAMCRGYHLQRGQPLAAAEIQALPWLMVEALVTEAAVTIAATGKFGPVDGLGMLRIVLAKGRWIRDNAAAFINAAASA